MSIKLDKMPFNIRLLSSNRNFLRGMLPVTSVDIYDGVTGQLSNEGLFSPLIFGRVGELRRNTTFSYIDLRTKLFHPLIFKNIDKLSAFYSGILTGQRYAIWDEKEKDFVESSQLDGETGFAFFYKYFKELKFKRNESDMRSLRIDVIEKYRDDALLDFFLVMPAALRDIEEDQKGNVTQDEINDLYRTLLGLSKNIDTQYPENKYNDGTRLTMQRTVFNIFNLIFSYIEGKKGLIQGKWAKRKIENGTRSVLAALDVSTDDIEGPQSIKINETVLGLFQSMKATLPRVQYAFKQPFIADIFGGGSGKARLINARSWEQEEVDISPYTYDLWMSEEGVNKLINQFGESESRHRYVKIHGAYLALVYRDARGFRILRDIKELGNRPRDKVSPITWAELFYYLSRPVTKEIPLFTTRYPITNENSMTPAWLYMKTTVKGEALFEYDEDWRYKTEDILYNEFPIRGEDFIDTLMDHPSKLLGKGADHDGDTGSADAAYSDDSIEEAKSYFGDVNTWFNSDGNIAQAFNTDTIKWFLNSVTGISK